MIRGTVTSFSEALVGVIVYGRDGREQEVEAVIDTGFTEALALPPGLVATLGLAWRETGRAVLADGTERTLDVYEAVVHWDGLLHRIAVHAADGDPLIGMALLSGYRLTIDVVEGGSVTIERLS